VVLEDAAFDEEGNPLPRVVVMPERTEAVTGGGKDGGGDRGYPTRVRRIANVLFTNVVLKRSKTPSLVLRKAPSVPSFPRWYYDTTADTRCSRQILPTEEKSLRGRLGLTICCERRRSDHLASHPKMYLLCALSGVGRDWHTDYRTARRCASVLHHRT